MVMMCLINVFLEDWNYSLCSSLNKKTKMKYNILLLLFLFLSCTPVDNEAEFKKNCPYELQFPGHNLRVPVTIEPHQLVYELGDTLKISAIFTDSIYDLGTAQTFLIENFPFKPVSLLFNVEENTSHTSGYGPNDLHISSIFSPDIFGSSSLANGYNARAIYSDGEYKFESELILKQTGRYILFFSDVYETNLNSGFAELNYEADAITFEGKCPTLGYRICSVIESGDDHLEEFESELLYLDNEVYSGKLGSIESSIGPLGAGGIRLEWNGGFGFEVVE